MNNILVVTGMPFSSDKVEILDFVEYEYCQRIYTQSVIEKVFNKDNSTSLNDAIAYFKKIAQQSGGNIVFDIKISTTTVQFKDGPFILGQVIATIGKLSK